MQLQYVYFDQKVNPSKFYLQSCESSLRVWNVNTSRNKDPGEFLLRAKILIL